MLNMMGSGVMGMHAVKAYLFILMKMYITGNGLIINAMVKGNIIIIKVLNIKDNGKMILNMDMVLRLGLTALISKVNIKRE